jgi:hypothetical protein
MATYPTAGDTLELTITGSDYSGLADILAAALRSGAIAGRVQAIPLSMRIGASVGVHRGSPAR